MIHYIPIYLCLMLELSVFWIVLLEPVFAEALRSLYFTPARCFDRVSAGPDELLDGVWLAVLLFPGRYLVVMSSGSL